jgi:hypothetical protein
MGKGAGFTVGPTVKACTKGIWIWGKAIEVGPGFGVCQQPIHYSNASRWRCRGSSYWATVCLFDPPAYAVSSHGGWIWEGHPLCRCVPLSVILCVILCVIECVAQVGGSDHLNVLFLDTEGLGSTIRGSTYDCRIFALSLLLSSYFVYNSLGVIDGDAISRLGLVVNLTKHIQVRRWRSCGLHRACASR